MIDHARPADTVLLYAAYDSREAADLALLDELRKLAAAGWFLICDPHATRWYAHKNGCNARVIEVDYRR